MGPYLIIKSILNKIYFHPIYVFIGLLSMLSGYFREFIIINLILFIHELGHIIIAIHYNWNIDKIYMFPFGGVTKFNELVNRPLKEELLIMLGGPFSQLLFFLLIHFLNGYYFFPWYHIFYKYHYIIFFFNLLPIFPLDGSKLINILFNYYFSFKFSHKLMIVVSYFFLVLLTILSFKDHILFITMPLFLIRIWEEGKNHEIKFNKFLLERYMYKFKYRKKYLCKNSYKNMRKEKYNLIKYNGSYVTEEELLKSYFKKM